MDSVLGVAGPGFVVIAADMSAARSILAYQYSDSKIQKLDDSKVMAGSGPQADRVRFMEYIEKNVTLNELRTGLKASCHGTAHMVRRELADALRKAPYQINLLLGGVDADGSSKLYWMDYIGVLQETKYGAQGHASHFTLSTMDRYYKEGMTLEEGKALIQRCINEVAVRFLISQPKWQMTVVTEDGIVDEIVSPEVDLTDKVPAGALGSVKVPGSGGAAAAAAESKE